MSANARPPIPPADAIEALALRHAETQRRCEALLPLLAPAGAAPAPAPAARATAAAELLAYFDGAAQRAREAQEHGVFPALIESMAGSDAVCLRGMTDGLRDERRRLDGIWRARLRPALAQLAAHAPATIDEAAARAWVADFQRYLQAADEELLPMAARLLTDEALAELGERWPPESIAPGALP
ncbi:hemerythrin domain-containing protein [Castellaniella sp. S9]|uniref:hemerythrin domain-containing protein n=1 Tax=Castellaniella sp. S9 TaxID=2993652 RepID=UPI0022B37EEA|nr:hemerythrin domain-containing protein [Castellaniella sp. S9]